MILLDKHARARDRKLGREQLVQDILWFVVDGQGI